MRAIAVDDYRTRTDAERQQWLNDRNLVLVRGHLVTADAVRTIGLDGVWRQLSDIGVRP